MYGNTNYGYQPMWQYPTNNTQAQNTSDILWVQGEAGAKSYPVAPGRTVILFDSENPVFYIKTVEASGMPQPLKTYDFAEHKPEPEKASASVDMSQYVTKAELKEYLTSLISEAKEGASNE